MTDTIQLAKECGALKNTYYSNTTFEFKTDELEAFRKRIEDEMKERCAVICDTGNYVEENVYLNEATQAIRSMK